MSNPITEHSSKCFAFGQRPRAALIVGASSGIGEALARRLAAEGWRLGLAARRLDKLDTLAVEFGFGTVVSAMDLAAPDEARLRFDTLVEELGGADLIVVAAGTGHVNPDLQWIPERETISVNVLGFAAVAQRAMEYFLERGRGHLVGVSSVAKLRADGDAAAYCASKAFVSTYLDGLRHKARTRKLPITVTEVCPGFVDTAMMKAEKPFWVASPATAAECIHDAIQRRTSHAFVTRRWGIIGIVLRLLPSPR